MERELERTFHERLTALEEKCAEQEMQIETLQFALADLIVAHAVKTGDIKPLAALREYYDFAWERFDGGGTERIPAEFFRRRAGALGEMLNHIFVTDFASNYRKQSLFRGYFHLGKRTQKIKRAIDALTNW